MFKSNNIRNIAITSQLFAGKTTLTEAFYCASVTAGPGASIENNVKENAVTLKSVGKSLRFTISSGIEIPTDVERSELLINWIDSPGHIDFSSDVNACLRLTDGCIILVDLLEGLQNENLVTRALFERVIPSIAFNKLDRVLEANMDSEDVYQLCASVVDNTNLIISTIKDSLLGNLTISPEKCNIGFFCASQGWGFTLNQFAGLYATKFGLDKQTMVQKLWGDNYYDVTTKTWTTKNISETGKLLSRAFCKFVLEPIAQIYAVTLSNNHDKLDHMLKATGVALTEQEKSLSGIDLFKLIMQKWFPLHKAVLELSLALPSPQKAQQYRVNNLYTGPQDDSTANSIRTCDPQGPLVMFVSKMIPYQGELAAFGRVFSGTVAPGAKIRALGSNNQHYWPSSSRQGTIKNVLNCGNEVQAVDFMCAGNLCAVTGLDILKYATLVSDNTSMPIVSVKLSSTPVMKVAVEPKYPADLPKLMEGLKKLSKTDPLAEVYVEEYGEQVIAGTGELHLEALLKDLQENYLQGVPIAVTEPIVAVRETVLEESSQICLAKSPNKHNRLWCQAKPMEENLIEATENGVITANDDVRKRARLLAQEYDWDLTEAKRIWSFAYGTNGDAGTNVLVDTTFGIQYLNEIRDCVVAGFTRAAMEGVLAEEPLRGVRFNLMDVTLHCDPIRRGGGQIIPTARRVFRGAQLTAKPRLMEPVYLVDIQCPVSVIANVFQVINNRGGQIIEEYLRREVLVANVRCYLPVINSLGLTAELNQVTGGQVLQQNVFHHWKVVTEDPLESGTRAEEMVTNLRRKKGLSPEVPSVETLVDKL